jgi:hypothetical protein
MASNAEWIRVFAEELQAILQQVQAAPLLATALSDVFSADRALGAGPDIDFEDEGAKGGISFKLTLTGVAPATYGAALKIPIITIDDKGRITGASEATLGTAATLDSDNDASLAANSNTRLPTQSAVKSFVEAAVTGVMSFKGDLNCSTNPNYPAGAKGDSYVASVAGKIGGASGKSVDAGDLIVCRAANAGGTEASVGASWFVLEHNLQGALLAANNLGDVPNPGTARTNLGLAIGSNVQAWDADLDAIAALAGIGVIYYRSAAGVWSPVLIGGNLAFAGGTLAVDKVLASGRYTPTLTNVANVDSSSAGPASYIRIGNEVFVTGTVFIDPTSIGVSTSVGFSLPIASNFGAATDANGTASSAGVQQSGAIEADASNDRAQIRYIATDASGRNMWYSYSYTII